MAESFLPARACSHAILCALYAPRITITALASLKVSEIFDGASSYTCELSLIGSVSVEPQVPRLAPQAFVGIIPVAHATAIYAPQTSLGPLIIDGPISFAWIRYAVRQLRSSFNLGHGQVADEASEAL